MTEIQGKSILVRVSARFELARVQSSYRESTVLCTLLVNHENAGFLKEIRPLYIYLPKTGLVGEMLDDTGLMTTKDCFLNNRGTEESATFCRLVLSKC